MGNLFKERETVVAGEDLNLTKEKYIYKNITHEKKDEN
jgi:hypothetical protein